jgi:hypothetical protein
MTTAMMYFMWRSMRMDRREFFFLLFFFHLISSLGAGSLVFQFPV